mgnify:CR=1 FL=1
MKEQEIKPCPYCGSTDIDYGKCLTNKTRTGKISIHALREESDSSFILDNMAT